VVKCRWVYALKFDDAGNIASHKARLVAKGFTQVLGEDYNETCYDLNKFNSGCNERQRLEGEKGIINEFIKRKEYRSITMLLIRLGLPRVTINGVGLSNYD
jgi:hypothetical protein